VTQFARTKTRLKLAQAIAAGKIRHYPFVAPKTFDSRGRLVTADVRLLEGAGLVDIPEPDEHNYSVVRLSPAGEEWSGFKNRTRKSSVSPAIPASTGEGDQFGILAPGPGSTSPPDTGGAE
jgi:hypothetical protein